MKLRDWLILGLIVAIIAQAIRGGVVSRRVARWQAAAAATVAVNDSILRVSDSLTLAQGRLTAALDRGAVERAKLTRTGAVLSAEVIRMRDKMANLPITPPDTCLPWAALSDTLARLVSVEAQRATLAESDLQRANTGRVEALAHAGALASRLRVADSLLTHYPKVTVARWSLLLDAHAGSDGRAEMTAAIRRGIVFAGVGLTEAGSRRIVAGLRADLRLF